MTLFFDRSLAKRLPRALRLLGLTVITHDTHFDAKTKDEVWLQRAGKEGWFVITADEHIRHNESEWRALADHDVGCFILVGAGELKRWDTARMIARNWERIEDISQNRPRPFLCSLYSRGTPKFRELPARSTMAE